MADTDLIWFFMGVALLYMTWQPKPINDAQRRMREQITKEADHVNPS